MSWQDDVMAEQEKADALEYDKNGRVIKVDPVEEEDGEDS